MPLRGSTGAASATVSTVSSQALSAILIEKLSYNVGCIIQSLEIRNTC